MNRRYAIAAILFTLGVGAARAERNLPAALNDWQDWATWNDIHRQCPMPFNNAGTNLCFWPSALAVAAEARGGRFTLGVAAFHEVWVPLPGSREVWPLNVRSGETPLVVVDRGGVPAVRLAAGAHALAGEFRWDEMPQRLAVPRTIGLLTLALEGRPVEIPNWDPEGSLWFKRLRSEEADKDFLGIQVYRVIEDGIPMWLRTEIEVSVAGKSREEEIGHILPEGWKLSMVDSPVPVAVDDQGRMKAQVRAGKWIVRADAFRTSHPAEFRFGAGARPAAARELVAFRARPEFRVVEVAGIPPVDVSQTTFPAKWRELPVYEWDPKASFRLEEKMRGMGLQKPAGLSIAREFWLDEDGRGLTYRDTIKGAMQRIWRLDAAPGQELGAVKINGTGLLVTKNPATGAPGVEVRSRNLDLDAVGRMARAGEVPATGWKTDADSLEIRWNLPPGWRLLALFGAEWVRGDWLTAWTLLDLFLLLVFALAVWRLWGVPAGVLALLAFGLAYHEPGAPRYTWLFLLAPMALLQVVPEGRARALAVAWKYLAVAILIVVLVPFVSRQVQSAIYPQLELGRGEAPGAGGRHGFAMPMLGGAAAPAARPEEVMQEAAAGGGQMLDKQKDAAMAQQTGSYGNRVLRRGGAESLGKLQIANLAYEPQARIQTGPGVPEWRWREASCGWNGPASADATIRPVLIPPGVQRLLVCLRVVLVLVLAAFLVGLRRVRNPLGKSAAAALGASLLFCSPPRASAQVPGDKMIETLRARLLEVPDAYPNAAEIPTVSLSLRERRIIVEADIHAAVRTAVPLPGRLPAWSPLSVQVDGAPPEALRREADYLWVVLPAGVHRVRVEGLLPPVTEWEWTFLLRPRYVAVDAPGWNVSGIRPNGIPEAQIFFSVQQRAAEAEAAYDRRDFNPVVALNRHIEIGLVWQARNVVSRLSPAGKAVSLRIPLLEGEKVLTSNLPVENGCVEVRLGASETSFTWESELPVKQRIALAAGATDRWVESWHVVVSPVWNLSLSGLEPVFETEAQELVPVWHPWPGEKVELAVSRPEAVGGATLTVRRVRHETDLGSRHRTARLALDLECSIGEDFPIALPDGAEVAELRHAGKPIPVRKDGAKVIVPVRPGTQAIEVSWKTARPLGLRAASDGVALPVGSANISTCIRVPENRWVLWASGPLRGPAVRFWSVLACALIAAQFLGALRLSPFGRVSWGLLALGLTQVHLFAALLVVGWLFLLAWRGGDAAGRPARPWVFNLLQILLALLAIGVASVLIAVLETGLLGQPEMFVQGNGSTRTDLRWFLPAAGSALPEPSVLSVSIWWYRFLMLAWALWLAQSLIGWTRWGWEQFSRGGLWKKSPPSGPVAPPRLA